MARAGDGGTEDNSGHDDRDYEGTFLSSSRGGAEGGATFRVKAALPG